MKKLLIFPLAALLLVACKPDEPTVNPDPSGNDTVDVKPGDDPSGAHGVFVSEAAIMPIGMSPNHMFVVGQTPEYKACYWDLVNGATELEGDGGLYAVTDAGVAVGANNDHAFYYQDGQVHLLPEPAGAYGSAAWDITADGALMVGFYYDETYSTRPCYWANGELHDLSYPSSDDMSFSVNGAATRWVSADGSVILGYLVDDFSSFPAVVWRKEGSDYVCDPICTDYFEDDYNKGRPYMVFGTDAMSLSENGEWITLIVQAEYDWSNWDVEPSPNQPARFNLLSKTLEVTETGTAFHSISNKGLAVGYDGDAPSERTPLVWLPGEANPVEFSLKFEQSLLGDVMSCSPMCIAADGSAVCGFIVDNEVSTNGFILY